MTRLVQPERLVRCLHQLTGGSALSSVSVVNERASTAALQGGGAARRPGREDVTLRTTSTVRFHRKRTPCGLRGLQA
jgi:hypothetical protein